MPLERPNRPDGSSENIQRVPRKLILDTIAPSLTDTNNNRRGSRAPARSLLGPASPFLYTGTYTIKNVGNKCRPFASVSADYSDNSITTGYVLQFVLLVLLLLLQRIQRHSAGCLELFDPSKVNKPAAVASTVDSIQAA